MGSRVEYEDNLEQLEEIFPKEHQSPVMLSLRFSIVQDWLFRYMEPGRLYKAKELSAILKGNGIDIALQTKNQPKMVTAVSRRATSMTLALNALWTHGLVKKFQKGIFKWSGRPIGVCWMRKDY